MRTTVDLPDALFRKTKAIAALRGASMKQLIIEAIEKEVASSTGGKVGTPVNFPLVKLSRIKKVNLEGFDFDDLLT